MSKTKNLKKHSTLIIVSVLSSFNAKVARFEVRKTDFLIQI